MDAVVETGEQELAQRRAIDIGMLYLSLARRPDCRIVLNPRRQAFQRCQIGRKDGRKRLSAE
ncbi:hypothetical protein [Methylocapsa palsarum]|uniref:hypothetical protein n=1 Tax=Methylocapsa palsarum TaxID=1612308 RepID=UPI001AECF7F0|nr:hypothetical protein [Methylocapsa palsarum]